jgi:hypothetical protein
MAYESRATQIYDKLKAWKQKKDEEANQRKQWEEEVRQKNYPTMYKQAYEKKLRAEVNQKFARGKGTGIGGRLRAGGFLQPDHRAINNALFGNVFAPRQIRRTVQSGRTIAKKHRKIVIYT